MDNSSVATTELITTFNVTTAKTNGMSKDSMDRVLTIAYVSMISTCIFITIIVVIMSILSERKRQISPQVKKTESSKKKSSSASSSKEPAGNKASSSKVLLNKKPTLTEENQSGFEKPSDKTKCSRGITNSISNSLTENAIGGIKSLHDRKDTLENLDIETQSDTTPVLTSLPSVFQMELGEKKPKTKRKKKRLKQLFETIEENTNNLSISKSEEEKTVPKVKKRKKKHKHKENDENESSYMKEQRYESGMVLVVDEEGCKTTGSQTETRKKKKRRRQDAHRTKTGGQDTDSGTEHIYIENSHNAITDETTVTTGEKRTTN